MSDQDFFVHESSCIDEDVQIGKGSSIWHFCHISKGARLGEKCKLGQNVFVAPGVCIGNNVKIQNNVSVYAGVTLEDNVFCGPSCVFTNVKTPRSAVVRNQPEDYRPTLVKHDASIGANATIVCGITLHEYAFVAAGAVVTRDVPAYALVAGVPARVVGWACECGHALAFEDVRVVCPECGKQYEKASELRVVRVGDEQPEPGCDY